MKRALIVTLASLAGCAVSGAANAQMRSFHVGLVPEGGVVLASDVMRDDAGQYNDEGLVEERPALPPRAILSMLSSSGFSALSPPMRRGPAYVVAVIDPNGTDGRVTVDAASGRIVRFRPIFGQGAMVIPDDVRGAYARRDLTPPRSIPNVPPRPASKLANRMPLPSSAAASDARSAAPSGGQSEKTVTVAATQAAKPVETKSVETRPETKPTVQIQPMQPIPPVQGFD